jgi:hypothetical protein
MSPTLTSCLTRLTDLATEVLQDHLGMIAPLIAEEVAAEVVASAPQNEQHVLAYFLLHLRRALPADLDKERVINTLHARYRTP